jgi:uncharacterized membrane protein
MVRLPYLDAARGVALALMVVNHTARYWAADDLARWPLVYLTTSAAGPTFLFLVGFVLPFSYRASPYPMRRAARRATSSCRRSSRCSGATCFTRSAWPCCWRR